MVLKGRSNREGDKKACKRGNMGGDYQNWQSGGVIKKYHTVEVS